MTDRELLQQALAALEIYGAQAPDVHDTIAALQARLAQPDRIQLTARDFVVTVGDIEDAVGTPMYWAEWPNKEKP